ncbi:hypothetical protein N665_0013s0020 [Sinapis alba]|nr:hypothetical protein N665_0013s0020 [Sinapis alba]
MLYDLCAFPGLMWEKLEPLQGKSSWKMKPIEETNCPFEMAKESELVSEKLKGLPYGIIQSRSDLELTPLWSSNTLRLRLSNRNLLAILVGFKQKDNVDALVQKFLPANFTAIFIDKEPYQQ